jgi:hypothetical protein
LRRASSSAACRARSSTARCDWIWYWRARAQRRAHHAHQRGDPHRPFHQDDVAQAADRLEHGIGIGAAAGQQQDRQVRPAWLRAQHLAQHGRPVGGPEHFLAQQYRAGAQFEFPDQVGLADAAVGRDAVPPEDVARQLRVARGGQQQQYPLPREIGGAHGAPSPPAATPRL